MTKLDYIGDVLCATALDFRHCDTVTALRGVIKTLQAVCEELDKVAARMQRGDDGGESVTNPTPAPVMPPEGTYNYSSPSVQAWAANGGEQGLDPKYKVAVDPIAKIKAMAASR